MLHLSKVREMNEERKIALRIDDIGASTKYFEIYSKVWYGNLLFLKFFMPFKAWGPYREINQEEWKDVLEILQKYAVKLTVAITACWVSWSGRLIEFYKKFPYEAKVIKRGVKMGVIDIANHGLTHCVTQNNLFRPRLFRGNRQYHREFWEWLEPKIHLEHIKKSQEILESFFETEIAVLVPPGNVFCEYTLEACEKYGIKVVNCQTSKRQNFRSVVVLPDNNGVDAFHDKDIVENSVSFLEETIQKYVKSGYQFVFVRELL